MTQERAKALTALQIEWRIMESVLEDACTNGIDQDCVEHQMLRVQKQLQELAVIEEEPSQ